jgi:hypothetical protein
MSAVHELLHEVPFSQVSSPGHAAAAAVTQTPLPSQLRAGVSCAPLHTAASHTVVAGYFAQAVPSPRHWPVVPHVDAPVSEHAVRQHTDPPPALGTHAPCRHWALFAHALPSGCSSHVPLGQ